MKKPKKIYIFFCCFCRRPAYPILEHLAGFYMEWEWFTWNETYDLHGMKRFNYMI